MSTLVCGGGSSAPWMTKPTSLAGAVEAGDGEAVDMALAGAQRLHGGEAVVDGIGVVPVGRDGQAAERAGAGRDRGPERGPGRIGDRPRRHQLAGGDVPVFGDFGA